MTGELQLLLNAELPQFTSPFAVAAPACFHLSFLLLELNSSGLSDKGSVWEGCIFKISLLLNSVHCNATFYSFFYYQAALR